MERDCTAASDPVTTLTVAAAEPLVMVFLAFGCLVALILLLFGFQAVQPNDARALLLFGEYQGSIVESGFFWVNPFCSKKRISLRVRNFETGSITTPEVKDAAGKILTHKTHSAGRPSKVNDRDGNPVDISAVVVWRVVNTAESLFEVDDYEHFVAVQSEAALRSLALRYPYDSEDHEVSLRGNTIQVCERLTKDLQERLDTAGVEVIDARISHLAYLAEIAAAMLQRQQAQAVVAARRTIVEGAVGMVHMALDHLSRRITLSSLTTSTARPWCRISSSCSAETSIRSRSSTPARCITDSATAPTHRMRSHLACREPRFSYDSIRGCMRRSSDGPKRRDGPRSPAAGLRHDRRMPAMPRTAAWKHAARITKRGAHQDMAADQRHCTAHGAFSRGSEQMATGNFLGNRASYLPVGVDFAPESP